MTVTGTPTDEKGKEVEDSYEKLDHVLVGNGKKAVPPTFISDRRVAQCYCQLLVIDTFRI